MYNVPCLQYRSFPGDAFNYMKREERKFHHHEFKFHSVFPIPETEEEPLELESSKRKRRRIIEEELQAKRSEIARLELSVFCQW
ncbi:hypothetical protein OROHE_011485 [Orobanche hederae]